MRVAVFGASGFTGATLVEKLTAREGVETRALIHSVGNAWRLARAQVPMQMVDVTSPSQVSEALSGCTHVVNCTRGPGKVMIAGLKNLLSASRAAKVSRFVHLSSVSVYGDPPPPESEREDAPARPQANSYGMEKLQQDNMVEQAVAAGLDCVTLCPPNISGIHSSFVINVLGDMRNGSFALVDGGNRALNTVDVESLAHAILLALETRKGDGKRIFVSDGTGHTWKDLADSLMPLAELSAPIPPIAADSLAPPPEAPKPRASLWRSLKHVVSSDVREALRRDPLWAGFDARIRRLAAAGGGGIEDRLRHSIEGPRRIAKVHDANPFSSRYNAMQLRGIWHRIDRAQEVLGYRPPAGFAESMARFRAWYQVMYGFGEPHWPLARLLNTI